MIKNKKKNIAIVLMIVIIFGSLQIFNMNVTNAPIAVNTVRVTYRTHVQSIGWQDWVTDGTMAGTSGKSLRLEGIQIKVDGNSNLGIAYTTHVQGYGWLPWSRDGEVSGTTGEGKRLEAIRIQLIGKDKDKYNVFYRVHAQKFGWMAWAKDGEPAGSAGFSYRLEGIQIVIIKKSGSLEQNTGGIKTVTGVPYSSSNGSTNAGASYTDKPVVMYKTHVQHIGWQNWVTNAQMAGTSGMSYRLEAINIKLSNMGYRGSIEYRTHVQSDGWQGWVKDGAMAGTSGRSLRLEGIQIRLTGDVAKYYDIYYRTHVQSIGWQSWKKNGEMAGTSGRALRLEAIEIKLVPKSVKVPDDKQNTDKPEEKTTEEKQGTTEDKPGTTEEKPSTTEETPGTTEETPGTTEVTQDDELLSKEVTVNGVEFYGPKAFRRKVNYTSSSYLSSFSLSFNTDNKSINWDDVTWKIESADIPIRVTYDYRHPEIAPKYFLEEKAQRFRWVNYEAGTWPEVFCITTRAETAPNGKALMFKLNVDEGNATGTFTVGAYYQNKLIRSWKVVVDEKDSYEVNLRKEIDKVEREQWTKDMTTAGKLDKIRWHVADTYTYAECTCLGGAQRMYYAARDLGLKDLKYICFEGSGTANFAGYTYDYLVPGSFSHVAISYTDENGKEIIREAQGAKPTGD